MTPAAPLLGERPLRHGADDLLGFEPIAEGLAERLEATLDDGLLLGLRARSPGAGRSSFLGLLHSALLSRGLSVIRLEGSRALGELLSGSSTRPGLPFPLVLVDDADPLELEAMPLFSGPPLVVAWTAPLPGSALAVAESLAPLLVELPEWDGRAADRLARRLALGRDDAADERPLWRHLLAAAGTPRRARRLISAALAAAASSRASRAEVLAATIVVLGLDGLAGLDVDPWLARDDGSLIEHAARFCGAVGPPPATGVAALGLPPKRRRRAGRDGPVAPEGWPRVVAPPVEPAREATVEAREALVEPSQEALVEPPREATVEPSEIEQHPRAVIDAREDTGSVSTAETTAAETRPRPADASPVDDPPAVSPIDGSPVGAGALEASGRTESASEDPPPLRGGSVRDPGEPDDAPTDPESDEGDELERKRARCVALGRRGDAGAVAELVRLLEDEHPAVRLSASHALATVDAEVAAPAVRPLLAAREASVRRSAAFVLGRLEDPASRDDLIRLLVDVSADARRAAAAALGNLGEESTVRPLLHALDDQHAGVRMAAESALSRVLGSLAPEALDVLIEHPDPTCRRAALRAAGRLGFGSRSVIEGRLQDEPPIALEAAEALGRRREDASQVALARAAAERKGELGSAAIAALERITGRPATEALAALIVEGDAEARAVAQAALARCPGAVEALVPWLQHDDEAVARTAAEALGRTGDARATQALLAVHETAQGELRRTAAASLVRLGYEGR